MLNTSKTKKLKFWSHPFSTHHVGESFKFFNPSQVNDRLFNMMMSIIICFKIDCLLDFQKSFSSTIEIIFRTKTFSEINWIFRFELENLWSEKSKSSKDWCGFLNKSVQVHFYSSQTSDYEVQRNPNHEVKPAVSFTNLRFPLQWGRMTLWPLSW